MRFLFHSCQVFLFDFSRPISTDTLCCIGTISISGKWNYLNELKSTGIFHVYMFLCKSICSCVYTHLASQQKLLLSSHGIKITCICMQYTISYKNRLHNFNKALQVQYVELLPHCVRWGPSSSPPKGAEPPRFSAHICSGKMAGWIKMPFGQGGRPQVGLSPSDIVLDVNPAPLPQKGTEPPNFRPIPVVAKWLDGSRCHLVQR